MEIFQIRMLQRIFHGDPFLGVKHQQLFEQIEPQLISVREKTVKILGLPYFDFP